jgi:hypothetical protein
LVLGPGVGRGAVKSGWFVNPPVNVDLNSLLRSDAIGRSNDCSFIPFLNSMWAKNLELTSGVTKLTTTREMRRALLHNAHVSRRHLPCAETYVMMSAVYGLTRDDEEAYKKLLNRVKTLPCIVDFNPLFKAAEVDGVSSREQDPTVDESPAILETPDISPTLYRRAMSVLAPVHPHVDNEEYKEDRPRRAARLGLQVNQLGVGSVHTRIAETEHSVELMPLLSPWDC